MIIFWTLVMFPLSLQRHVEALERFSSLGVLSIIFLVMAAVIHSVSHGAVIGKADGTKTHHADIRSMLWPSSFWEVIQALPIIIFAFSCQVNVCAIFEELAPADATNTSDAIFMLRSKQRIMGRITRYGIMLCMTLYVCIGLFGYLDFAQGTLDNILNNYCVQSTHDPLMTAASAFVAVAVVVAFPFNILPARITLKLILERMKRRRRCGSFFSSVTRVNFLWRKKHRNSNTSTEVESDASSSPVDQYNGREVVDGSEDALDPLLSDDDRFGDRPNLVPHMSLEGMPVEEEIECADESSPLEHFLLTLFLSGSALIVALLIPGISVVFGLMGGTAASIISFILPGMFVMNGGLSDESQENGIPMGRSRFLPLLFVWGGASIGVLSTLVTVYGMLVSPSNDASVNTCGD